MSIRRFSHPGRGLTKYLPNPTVPGGNRLGLWDTYQTPTTHLGLHSQTTRLQGHNEMALLTDRKSVNDWPKVSFRSDIQKKSTHLKSFAWLITDKDLNLLISKVFRWTCHLWYIVNITMNTTTSKIQVNNSQNIWNLIHVPPKIKYM